MDIAVNQTSEDRDTATGTVRVWDPLVRVFHWSLAGGFLVAFATSEGFDNLHIVAGYTVAALVGARVVWGLIGTKHARFTDFIYRPSKVVGYVKEVRARKAKRYMGHNPAGGMMVIALLLAIAGISGTGYLLTLDAWRRVWWVGGLHETLVNGTVILIVAHIAGVLLSSYEHKENLIRSMITGMKRK